MPQSFFQNENWTQSAAKLPPDTENVSEGHQEFKKCLQKCSNSSTWPGGLRAALWINPAEPGSSSGLNPNGFNNICSEKNLLNALQHFTGALAPPKQQAPNLLATVLSGRILDRRLQHNTRSLRNQRKARIYTCPKPRGPEMQIPKKPRAPLFNTGGCLSSNCTVQKAPHTDAV